MTEYKKRHMSPGEIYLKWSCCWSRLLYLVETWLFLFDRKDLSISWGYSAHVLTVISRVNYIALCTDIISSSLRVLATFSVRQVCLNMTALLNRDWDCLLETFLSCNSLCLPNATQTFSVHTAGKILTRQTFYGTDSGVTWDRCLSFHWALIWQIRTRGMVSLTVFGFGVSVCCSLLWNWRGPQILYCSVVAYYGNVGLCPTGLIYRTS